MVTYDVTWRSRTEKLEILTADDLHVATDVTVTYRPVEAGLHRLHLEIGPDYYDRLIQPAFVTIARSEFAKHAHNDLARDGPAVETAVLAELRKAIGEHPIEIDRVSIKHIEYDPNLSAAISQKLATLQRVEQKDAEVAIAERDAEITRTAARGRGDAIRIEAEGQAAAMVLKGAAQAKAQSEITRTLTPRYLQYKAFDGETTRYYFVPIGRDGMPVIIGTDSRPADRFPMTGSR